MTISLVSQGWLHRGVTFELGFMNSAGALSILRWAEAGWGQECCRLSQRSHVCGCAGDQREHCSPYNTAGTAEGRLEEQLSNHIKASALVG